MTRRSMSPARALTAALATVAMAAVAACGSEQSGSSTPPDPSAPVAPIVTRPPADAPTSTLSADIPDSFDGAVAPVDVLGERLPPLADTVPDPAVGRTAPVLVGYDLDDRPIRIDPAVDGPTMLVFVAHWCPHCNDEIPKLNEMRSQGEFPDALEIVAVSTAVSPDRPNFPPTDWLEGEMEWAYPAMLDGIDVDAGVFVAADAYGVTGFPFTALVDGDGTVVDRWSGEREPDEIVERIDGLGVG